MSTALLTIAELCTRPSARPQMRDEKPWHVYTVEYDSAVKKKDVLPFRTARTGLEGLTE